jgi:prepilin-type N-terminal cleavage/methylation domain-containing protein
MSTAYRHRRAPRGLSIVEMLISLVIAAALLTAAAIAFSASAKAIEQNDQVMRATQAARVTMLHLLSEIRNGTVDENSTADEMRLISGTEGIIPDDRTYRFADGKLMLLTNSDETDPDYVLARNVVTTDSRFEYEITKDANNTDLVSRVAVTIVVKINGNEMRLTGTASPRQYLTYQ